jgi:thiamine pyrophosphate-dependent acetolactate synthase large subunit-like protein
VFRADRVWFLSSVGVGVLQVPRRMIGTDAFQETPIVEVTRQITKHNYLVMDVKDIPRVIKEVRKLLL